MDDQLRDVLSDVLELPANGIDGETSSDTVDNWDSLRHMNLVMALEDEFGVSFEEEEMIELISFPAILRALQEKLA